jgi:hypothetical protein
VTGQEKPWLQVVAKILRLATVADFEVHICRQYVLNEGSMVFGWHVGIETKKAAELDAALTSIKDLLVDVGPGFQDKPEVAVATPAVPSVEQDPEVLKARIQAHTTAHPRSPSYSGPDPVIPPNAPAPKLQMTRNSTDRNTGLPIVEYEMPLPNVYTQDMNKPNAKGRGAWLGDFHVSVGKK